MALKDKLPAIKQGAFLTVASACLCWSCGSRPGAAKENTSVKIEDTVKQAVTTVKDVVEQEETVYPNWMDSVMLHYILHSPNEQVQLAVKDSLHEEWLPDQPLRTDTATYWIFQVGHDVTDEGAMNPRFVTDQWIYIDTASRQLYEYDLPNERLAPWRDRK